MNVSLRDARFKLKISRLGKHKSFVAVLFFDKPLSHATPQIAHDKVAQLISLESGVLNIYFTLCWLQHFIDVRQKRFVKVQI